MPIPLVTRILVADDYPIVRSGLKKVLDAAPDLEVVAEAEDGAEAVEKALSEDIHLVILDVSMPRMTGIQAAAELHKRKPELKTLMLSMHDSEQFLFEALKAGASGYVLKSGADTDIVEACRVCDAGGLVPLSVGGDDARSRLRRSRWNRRGAVRHPDPARTRGAQAHRGGANLERDRCDAVHQRQDRRPPSPEHPRQARDARPGRVDALRDPSRTDSAVVIDQPSRLGVRAICNGGRRR